MAKRGGTKHLKRIAISKAVLITNKKKYNWIVNPSPGPHNRENSVPLRVIIREMLGFAKTAREVDNILNSRLVAIDGIARTDSSFPVGLFDILSFSKADKNYIITIDNKGRLIPKEIEKTDKKLLKVVGKHTLKKGKVNIAFHDGKNIIADNNINVGDTVLINLGNNKPEKVLKLEKGATCMITEGKHAGTVAKLTEIIERKEGKPAEAKLAGKEGEFITVAKYLFVVEDHFSGGVHG